MMPLALSFESVHEQLIWLRDRVFVGNLALELAFVFVSALLVARLASAFKYLPKVTAYLLVGLACGPYAAGILSEPYVKDMQVVKDIALALILFLVGTELSLKSLSSVAKSANRIALVEIGLTLALVGGGVLLATRLTGGDWRLAPILACFAVATAPAATLAVVKEYNADGPVSRHIKALVARNDTFALILFGLLAPFVLGGNGGGDFVQDRLVPSLIWVGLPFPLGLGVGLALAYLETLQEKAPLRLLLGLGGLMMCIGLAQYARCSVILTVLFAGFIYANSSVKKAPLRELLGTLEIPFYVIFFILSGAKLDVQALLALGWIGAVFVILRTVGKTVGPWAGARLAGMDRANARYLGMSLLSQSAIAISIATVAAERLGPDHDLSKSVWALVLGSVLVFEIAGPILVKVSVLKSGEVAIANAVKHRDRLTGGNQFAAVVVELLVHLGLRKHRRLRELPDLVIKNNQALAREAGFDKITKFIQTYSYDSFPIVDKEGFYVGYISYNEIKDAGFDPVMKDLVRAADLITSAKAIDLDEDDIDSAYAKMRDLPNTALPAIKHKDGGEKRVLVGVVAQKDLLQAYMERH